jgi:hypothetical protein
LCQNHGTDYSYLKETEPWVANIFTNLKCENSAKRIEMIAKDPGENQESL